MPAAPDAPPGRRAARWVAPVGLCGGTVCLLVGAAFHLSAEPAAPPSMRAEGTGDAAPAALQDDISRPNEQPRHSTVEQIEPSVATTMPEESERPRAGRFGQAAPDGPPGARAETRLRAAVNRLALPAVAVLGTMLMAVGAVFALLDRMGVLAPVTVRRHGTETSESRHDLRAPEPRSAYAPPAGNDAAEVPAPRDHGTGRMDAGEAAPAGARAVPAPDPAPPDAEPLRSAELSSPTTAVPYASRREVGGVASRNSELSQHGTTAPVAGEEAGGEVSPSVGPRRARAAGPGPEDAARTESTGIAELSPERAAAPAFTDTARPDAGMQSPEPRAPGNETAASLLGVDGPPRREPAGPSDLIDAWDDYRRNGDGHFSPRGLQEVLYRWGFDMDVGHGKRVGAGGAALVVEAFGTPNFYVLPSFNKSPRAVADWFDDHSGGALTGRTRRVTRLARGRWLEPGTETGRRFEVIEKGEIA